MDPEISVVIATYRRPDLLRRCLDAVVRQTLPQSSYDVIVAADDAGQEGGDATLAVVDAINAEQGGAPLFRYVPVTRTQGPAGARNAGWRQSGARVIAFTDDDTIPDPDWLRAGLAALDGGLDAAGGAIRMPLPERPTDYERDAAGLAHAEFATANCFAIRAALVATGGFDERFTSAWREDSDLHFSLLRAGYRVGFADDALVVHPVRPGRFAISIGQQKKTVFDALLYKKHRALYRSRIRSAPPWDYYVGVAALIVAAVAAATGGGTVAAAAAVVWLALTLRFAAVRLSGTSHRPLHVIEMLWTSIVIPPVAIAWRLVGAFRFRVAFL